MELKIKYFLSAETENPCKLKNEQSCLEDNIYTAIRNSLTMAILSP